MHPTRSYRRGKPEMGDIDFTILPPRSHGPCKPLLHRILYRLRDIVRLYSLCFLARLSFLL